MTVNWASLPGDRWSVLAKLGRAQPVMVAIPPDAIVDPIALLTAGARAVVVEGCSAAELALALASTETGGRFVSPGAAAKAGVVPRSGGRRTADPLGPREVETLRCLASGLTHRETARRLGVTETTIGTYAKRLRRKLNAANSAQLTQRAIDLGYLAPPGVGGDAT